MSLQSQCVIGLSISHAHFFFFFLVTLFRVGFFYLQLTLRQLIQPDLESRFIVRFQLGPSIQSVPLLVLNYRWSHNPPTYRRTVTPTGIEPTLFRNSASKVAGLQVHATTSGLWVRTLCVLCFERVRERKLTKEGTCSTGNTLFCSCGKYRPMLLMQKLFAAWINMKFVNVSSKVYFHSCLKYFYPVIYQ